MRVQMVAGDQNTEEQSEEESKNWGETQKNWTENKPEKREENEK